MKLIRTPPLEVRRQLRREVRFGCPVSGCGNPYLRWHHFDPPWSERQHHDPAGMIALCGEHHAKADAGGFTKEQLRELKQRGAEGAQERGGQFNWMRRDLVAVVGGVFYYRTPIIFEFCGQPAIWVNRDEEGYLLLNIQMATISGQPRAQLEDNFWVTQGDPVDVECPPSGKLLRVEYANGDRLRIEFFELKSAAQAKKRYCWAQPEYWGIPFPITAVEVQEKVGGTDIEFGPQETAIFGGGMRGGFIEGCRVGLSVS
jgi:hypothetical protein